MREEDTIRPGGIRASSLTKESANRSINSRNGYAGPVNPRVKSAIKTSKKIDRDSRAVEREKAASTARSPLGRIGVRLLFATKVA